MIEQTYEGRKDRKKEGKKEGKKEVTKELDVPLMTVSSVCTPVHSIQTEGLKQLLVVTTCLLLCSHLK